MTKSWSDEYSHIHGLYIDSNLKPTPTGPLFGHVKAREALFLISNLVKSKRYSGTGILLCGPPLSGKSALLAGFSRELGTKFPFKIVNATEIILERSNKINHINLLLRSSIRARFDKTRQIYEGEVVDIDFVLTEKFGKDKLQKIIVTLRSAKESKQITLDPTLYKILEKENIQIGDVAHFEVSSGIICRLGKSENYLNENQLEIEHFVPLPKNKVMRKLRDRSDVTLHDIDTSYNVPNGLDSGSLFIRSIAPSKPITGKRVQKRVLEDLERYTKSEICELFPGVLVIEDAFLLDRECLAHFKTIMEQELCPLIIFISNKPQGTGVNSSDKGSSAVFGMCRKFLQNLLIVELESNDRYAENQIFRMLLGVKELSIDEKEIQHVENTLSFQQQLILLDMIPNKSKESVKAIVYRLCEALKSSNI